MIHFGWHIKEGNLLGVSFVAMNFLYIFLWLDTENCVTSSPFPTVAEAIQEELELLKSSEEEVKKLKASMGIDNESDIVFSMMSDNTAKLTSAVNSLPQLLERKRLIDMHTTIATSKNDDHVAD